MIADIQVIHIIQFTEIFRITHYERIQYRIRNTATEEQSESHRRQHNEYKS